jgi:hypothetical protein
LGLAGTSFTFSGTVTDPGADDLTLSWDWDDGDPSPDTATFYPVPYSVTESQIHTFDGGCLHNITLSAEDDDGGYGEDSVLVLVQGTEDKFRYEGYWQSSLGSPDDSEEIWCLLAIANHVSNVFSEVRDASTIEAAYDVMHLKQNGGSTIEQLDRELMQAWLNFANGAVGYFELLDTDKDGVGDTPFHEIVAVAESVRLDPDASVGQLKAQIKILHHIKQMEKKARESTTP